MVARSPGRAPLQNRIRLVTELGSRAGVSHWFARDECDGRELYALQVSAGPGRGVRRAQQVAVRYLRQSVYLQSVDPGRFPVSVGAFVAGGNVWCVEERPHGRTLGDFVAHHRVSRPQAARIGLAMLRTLSVAHSKGIVRGFIAPEQVWIGESGSVVLSGSGSGELLASGCVPLLPRARTLAPEISARSPLEPAADLWAFGRILAFLLVGNVNPSGGAAARDPAVRLVRDLMREEKEARPSASAARRALLRILQEENRLSAVPPRPAVPPHPAFPAT
ncbi:hypothetical protein [Streptomyces sp. SID5643]|uniref:hypothetical protein n=1 Tax=Streptomyces sp. SID5643 TaxID=2690307 RepID=UPI00136E4C97|nr:hypothetical protein [Streptomyces sp. SID5643]MZF89473.1 hypothetical protein [Streptomyces sp. SID5643]